MLTGQQTPVDSCEVIIEKEGTTDGGTSEEHYMNLQQQQSMTKRYSKLRTNSWQLIDGLVAGMNYIFFGCQINENQTSSTVSSIITTSNLLPTAKGVLDPESPIYYDFLEIIKDGLAWAMLVDRERIKFIELPDI